MPRRTQNASIRKWSARCTRMFRRRPREPSHICHSRGGRVSHHQSAPSGAAGIQRHYISVIPAAAGIQRHHQSVIPAKAGIHWFLAVPKWIPAFAGMTTSGPRWDRRRVACVVRVAWVAWVALVLGAGIAVAQTPEGQLTGTLQKVRTSGTVAIGYREASIPLSYLSARNEPIGYSIDLCRAIVDAMSTEVGRDLDIKWVPVTSENRINAVVNGQVDLECGSTTSNLERKKVVDFSAVIFIAGTKLMVKTGSPIKSFRDLSGRSVVVTKGTTNEKTLRELVAKFKINATIATGADHADSYAQLVQGKVDA